MLGGDIFSLQEMLGHEDIRWLFDLMANQLPMSKTG